MSSSLFQFSSVQDGIYALGKAHMRSTPSLRSFPNVAFETVPVFLWLTMALSRPFKEDRRPLSLSTSLSSRRPIYDVLGFVPAGSGSSSSILPRRRPLVMVALPASCLFARSFPSTPACPGQYIQKSFRWRMSTIDTSIHHVPEFKPCVFVPWVAQVIAMAYCSVCCGR